MIFSQISRHSSATCETWRWVQRTCSPRWWCVSPAGRNNSSFCLFWLFWAPGIDSRWVSIPDQRLHSRHCSSSPFSHTSPRRCGSESATHRKRPWEEQRHLNIFISVLHFNPQSFISGLLHNVFVLKVLFSKNDEIHTGKMTI